MKRTKYIRIDETSRRFLGRLFKDLAQNPTVVFLSEGSFEDISRLDSFLNGNQPKGDNTYPNIGNEEKGPLPPSFGRNNWPSVNQENLIEVPTYLLGKIMKANNNFLAFSQELEQQGMAKERIEEYQYDSFKISLRILEGILLQFFRPWLASRQFDLAEIHTENTLITLENFKEDKIGSSQKIEMLKQNCLELIMVINELKRYFGLEKL